MKDMEWEDMGSIQLYLIIIFQDWNELSLVKDYPTGNARETKTCDHSTLEYDQAGTEAQEGES